MALVSSHPSPERPLRQSSGSAAAALVLGIVALVAFLLLVLPTDLLLFDLAGVPILGALAQTLYPLALGPEILFSPVGLLPAIVAIVVGGRHLRIAAGIDGPSAVFARTGVILGWLVVAFDALSLVLIILSFQGVLKPLI